MVLTEDHRLSKKARTFNKALVVKASKPISRSGFVGNAANQVLSSGFRVSPDKHGQNNTPRCKVGTCVNPLADF